MERNLFLGIAKLVWAFDINPGKEKNGKVAGPDMDSYTECNASFLVCAEDFGCEKGRGQFKGV